MSRYEYDAAGNLTREYGPSNFADESNPTICTNAFKPGLGSVSEYEYDGFNKLLKRSSTDLGSATTHSVNEIEYRYNWKGALRFVRDPNHKIKGGQYVIAYIYDSQGRLEKTVDIQDDNADFFNDQTIINNDRWPLKADVLSYKVLQQNEYDIYGRLLKTKGYTDVAREPVESRYQYDEDGNLVQIVEKIPGIRTVNHNYAYSSGGLVLSYFFMNEGHPDYFKREMEYDYTGKLINVKTTGRNDPEMSYEYQDPRAVLTKAANPVLTTANTYDIQGRLEKITAKDDAQTVVFDQEIAYDKGQLGTISLTPQYNGNIAGLAYKGVSAYSGVQELFKYTYDGLGRLMHTSYADENGYKDSLFNSTMTYQVDGAIATNSRTVLEETSPSNFENVTKSGTYHYYPNNHRLRNVAGDLRQVNEDYDPEDNNFDYDYNGNLIQDKTKKLKIDYDWRNMPIRFRMYTDAAMTQLKQVVQMVYNASGNRVAKVTYTSEQ